MRILIVIGAGASLDCWPGEQIDERNRLPLANNLFANFESQNKYLSEYDLMGIASILRRRAREKGVSFDIEEELADIADKAEKRNDLNDQKALFKTRFYLHSLINGLTKFTLNHTSTHTTYVDLISQLKEWIDEDKSNRFVDIVTFNYDNLIEKAMENVYGYDWGIKSSDPMTAYYSGTNLKIYKPHGSTNWGRMIKGADRNFLYVQPIDAFSRFNNMHVKDEFIYVDTDTFNNINVPKKYIPAIAIPLRNKTDFQECPEQMLEAMKVAVDHSDVIVSIGWKGADAHFVDLLKRRKDGIGTVHHVSPNGFTKLSAIYSANIEDHKFGFRDFVSGSSGLSDLLSLLSNNS